MGIFSVDKGAKNMAKTYEYMASDLENQQKDIEFGRELLTNIRKYRIASEQMRFYNQSDIAVTSSAAGGQANLASSLASEVGYAYDTSERLQAIQDYKQKAANAWEEYAESVKKAGRAGQIVGTVTTAIGAAVGGPVGAAVGAAIGAGITSAMGGGHVATGSAIRSGVVGTVSAGIGSAIGGGAAGVGTDAGILAEAGGTASTVSYSSAAGTMTANAGTTISTSTVASSSAWTAGQSWSGFFNVVGKSDMMRGSWYYG